MIDIEYKPNDKKLYDSIRNILKMTTNDSYKAQTIMEMFGRFPLNVDPTHKAHVQSILNEHDNIFIAASINGADVYSTLSTCFRLFHERAEAAKRYINSGNAQTNKSYIEYIEHINENIKKVLGL